MALFLWHGNRDVSIFDDAVMVALQKKGTRLCLVAIQRATGGTGNFHIVVVHLAVAQNGDMATHERNVKRSPFAEPQLRSRRRRVITINRAHLVRRLGAAFGSHLNFVAASQIDAAITAFGAIDFDVKFEILKLRGRF